MSAVNILFGTVVIALMILLLRILAVNADRTASTVPLFDNFDTDAFATQLANSVEPPTVSSDAPADEAHHFEYKPLRMSR